MGHLIWDEDRATYIESNHWLYNEEEEDQWGKPPLVGKNEYLRIEVTLSRLKYDYFRVVVLELNREELLASDSHDGDLFYTAAELFLRWTYEQPK